MRKLILKCGLSPGDIVMLTAAVRDLHQCYPGQFVTDVRTSCPALWENNPHITPVSEEDPEVEIIHCEYPLINEANKLPYHCLHGFVEFLNERLNLSIKLQTLKGDIYLAEQEKLWYSQVHEATREDTPFWIVAAGGKYDITIKWWHWERYQEVVNHFRNKILFVQVGQRGHYHPRLEGVLDLRGRTNLRELVRLVHHSQGVLCSVTALMHLAAAVETKHGFPKQRACVVVAGGREPTNWAAYTGHQLIHTIGYLKCCAKGGCWKDRTMPLRDGDPRDEPGRLCVDVAGELPRCMDLITPSEVIRRIQLPYDGGVLNYLTPPQNKAAKRGIAARATNTYDKQALNLHSAGMECEQFISRISAYPQSKFQGRGIVMCAGGPRYFACAWVCIKMLRRLGCQLPIQVWHLGSQEMDQRMCSLLSSLGAECVDASKVRKRFPMRVMGGWELKPYAIIHSPFRKVLFLDADNVPVVNPEFLFQTQEFEKTGAIFWPDFEHSRQEKTLAIWRSCSLREPKEREFESGQILVDKKGCWRALQLTLWFNDNSDFYYRHVHGDKETFHLAFRKVRQPYSLVSKPIERLAGTMCQHDFRGRRIFQHRNMDKWDLLQTNNKVPGFLYEDECQRYVAELKETLGEDLVPNLGRKGPAVHTGRKFKNAPFTISAVMISCPDREALRRQTLKNLGRTDWNNSPLHIQIDEGVESDRELRQIQCSYLALKQILKSNSDYILFLEDDLDFNVHFLHNLKHWKPLSTRSIALASLYNPRIREMVCDPKNNTRFMSPQSVFGSQAFLLSKEAAKYVVRRWEKVEGKQDIKISRLAGHLNKWVAYHAPSLVQHIGEASLWGGRFHQAADFDREWQAV